MKYLDLSFNDPAVNLACDEALLDFFESEKPGDGLLRVWEPRNHFIVLGHSNRLSSEVDLVACLERRLPILRRISGGGAVMQGPGCLNYSLILNIQTHGVKSIRDAFLYVLQRHCGAIGALIGTKACIKGISDLTVAGRKFSGNAQYRKSQYVLVHGTFLLEFELFLVDRYLKIPAKQPNYRHDRPHLEFITNLKLESVQVREGLRNAWNASEESPVVPLPRIETLVRERYGREEWSRKF
jgi:lipoate-protein ligase A